MNSLLLYSFPYKEQEYPIFSVIGYNTQGTGNLVLWVIYFRIFQRCCPVSGKFQVAKPERDNNRLVCYNCQNKDKVIKMKPFLTVLLIFGLMVVMHSAFAVPIIPTVEDAIVDILDADGNIVRTDVYTDILNELVEFEGDQSSFVDGSGVVLTDSDPDEYYMVDFNLLVDTDPWYVWSVGIFNNSSTQIQVRTQTFNGVFTEDVGAGSTVSSEIFGGILDFYGNGVIVAPVNQSKIAVTELFTDSRSENMTVDVGSSFTAPPTGVFFTTYPYQQTVAPHIGPSPAPDLLWKGFRTTVSFGVTPLDQAVFTGRVEVIPAASPTPEPSTIFLLGSGLVMVGLAVWRRKRQS